MPNILLEVCCGSADDVIEAWKAGANRVELNSSLFHGGLTPTIGSLQVVKKEVPLPVMTMIRPRAGGFCYTPMEFKTAIADAQLMIRHGTDGLVFGFLNENGTVDKARTGELAAIAGDKTTVFHRALDVTPDWRKALETLIGLGIKRVLTSGQAPSVFYALDTIAQMVRFADGQIEILPGAGITLSNAARVVAETGCTQIHIAQHRKMTDLSTANNRDIFFGGALYPPEDTFDIIDRSYISLVREHIK